MIDRWFITGIIENNELLWITELGGHVMKMSLDTHTIEYANIDAVCYDKDLTHSSAIFAENGIIYFFVNWGKWLLTLNEKKATYNFFYLGLEKYYLNMCASVSKQGDELLVVPLYASELIRVNVLTGEVQFEQILKDKTEKNDKELLQYFVKCDQIETEVIWIFSHMNREVICYNSNTREKTYYKMPFEIQNLSDILIKNGEFYILSFEGDVYLWEKDEEKCEKIFNNTQKRIGEAFSVLCMVNNQLWLFPFMEKDILIYDIEKKSITIFDKYPEDFSYCAPKEMGKYTCKIEDEANYYLAMHAGNYIFSIDKKTGQGNWIDAKWPSEEMELEYLLKRNKCQFLEPEISQKTFINYIAKLEKGNRENECENGRNIWKQSKGV